MLIAYYDHTCDSHEIFKPYHVSGSDSYEEHINKYNVIALDITVENAFIRYEFTIQRNITVIRGWSATGKTTLVEMIREYYELPDTGINIKCNKNLVVLYGRDWKNRLMDISDSIVFIDEQSRFVKTHEFAEAVKDSDNYYVIVTREKLSELPYSVTEMYGIRTRGKYAGLVGEYTANEFGLFKSNEVNNKCHNTYDYADSVKYMSWEQFYAELLIAITKDTEMQYSKHKLNAYYLSARNMELITDSLPDILMIRS